MPRPRVWRLPPGEIERLWNSLYAEGELADDELNNISGGCGDTVYLPVDEIHSGDAHCPYCRNPLKYLKVGRHLFTVDGIEYQCDEFVCDSEFCTIQDPYQFKHFIHVWEGDRWFVQSAG